MYSEIKTKDYILMAALGVLVIGMFVLAITTGMTNY